jgi:DNA-binding CsgD family transcriptional regulator
MNAAFSKVAAFEPTGAELPGGKAECPRCGIQFRVLSTQPTKREIEVEDLAMTGLSLKEMGDRLGIADRTVQAHIASLCKKRGVHGLRELMALRIRELSSR